MSQQLMIELSDGIIASVNRLAQSEGVSPSEVASRLVEKGLNGTSGYRVNDLRSDAEKDAARGRFASHFGSVSVGSGNALDNEKIDEDLAHEYGSNHEDLYAN